MMSRNIALRAPRGEYRVDVHGG